MTTELKKVKFPIGLKLILIITSIVLISLGIVAFIVSYFTGEDTQIVAEQNNHTINLRSATSVESELNTIRANSFLLLDMISTTGTSAALSRQASAFFFERNLDAPNPYGRYPKGICSTFCSRFFSRTWR